MGEPGPDMDGLVIKNTTLVTVDRSDRILHGAAIAVRGTQIVGLGRSEDVEAEHPAREVIDGHGMVVLPGLINSHVHVLTALYKGTMPGLDFMRIAGEDIDLCGRATPEIMHAAARLAVAEMLLSGNTLANVAGDGISFDVCRQPAEALGQAGMKGFVQSLVQDWFPPADVGVEEQLAGVESLVDAYHGSFDGRIRVAPSPTEPMVASMATMRRLAALSDRRDLVIHMHVLPRWPMGSWNPVIRGHSTMGLIRAAGLLRERLVAVHVLGANRFDMRSLAEAGASIVHCPSVWMNVGVGPRHWLPLQAARDAGINIMLGADSLGGWIEGADLFTEMRNALLMAHFLDGPGSLSAREVLRMATINAARGLGLQAETGSLEVGKRADFVLLRCDRPPLAPSTDLPAMIVNGASRANVRSVVVDGRFLVRDGRLETLDERRVLADAADARAELFQRGGWRLGRDAAVRPPTSWLERYPNQRVAGWASRWARLRGRQPAGTDNRST